MKTILVSRTDRLGDLILTLPVFSALRAAFPHARLIAHVRQYTAPVLYNRADIDDIILDDDPRWCAAPGNELARALRLAKLFRQRGVTAAVVVHPVFRALAAARLAGAYPVTGRASNLWQGLLTHRQVQHRSRNEKHEAEYNLDLVTGLGISPASVTSGSWRPTIQVSEGERMRGQMILKDLNLDHPVAIHPGHGGSASNLPVDRYRDLAGRIRQAGLPVVISLGPQERHLADTFAGFPVLPGPDDLRTLIGVYANIRAWVGGSTGPMHLAAALGKPVAAFFPPVFAMSPRRWGPIGERNLVMVPEGGVCHGTCTGCGRQGCMAAIDLGPCVAWLQENREV